MTTILEEIAKKHLPYEIDMLRQTYRKLVEGQVPDEVVGNALIESFCVHARSLLDFFESRPNKRDDDYVATDFTSIFVPRINQSIDPFKTLRTKLNKEIFHLTGGRMSRMRRQTNSTCGPTEGNLFVSLSRKLHGSSLAFLPILKRSLNATSRLSPIRKLIPSKVRRTAQASSAIWDSSVIPTKNAPREKLNALCHKAFSASTAWSSTRQPAGASPHWTVSCQQRRSFSTMRKFFRKSTSGLILLSISIR
jgi:hypothetical protein